MVDPWGGYTEASAQLNNTLARMPDQDLSRQTARQQLALGALQLQGAQRKEQDTQDYRDKLANLQPTQQTVTTDQMGPGAPIANPSAPADRAALAAKIQSMKSQQYDPAKSFGDQDTLGATIPQSAYELQQQQIAPLQEQLDQPSQMEGPLPQRTMQQTVPVTAEQRIAALTEHAMKTGDYDPVTKAISMEGILAKRKVELEESGGDMTAYVKAQTDLQNSKDLMATISPLLLKGQAGRQMAANYLAAYKTAHPNNPMIQNANIDDYGTGDGGIVQSVKDPQTGQILGHYIMNPTKGEMEFKQSNAAEVANTDFGTFKNGFKQEHPKATDADISRAWQQSQLARETAKRQVIVNNPMPAKINVNQLDPDEQAAINAAVGAGIIDPYKINSRNQKTLAQAIIANPNTNINDLAAKMGLARNVKVQDKAGNAAMLPDMIKDVQESGKKLGYSDLSPVGKGQQWVDKLTNDPNYINYSAKRNDIIMRIGGVMRENGMTDQAQKLEEDSAPRSMSPRAFDAWAKAQMSVLGPIMAKYTSQAQGRGTPMGESSNIPAQAITMLKSNPQLRAQFEAKYGAGSAKKALGN